MRCKYFRKILLSIIGFMACLSGLHAQLELSLASPRDTFLLYEPMVFTLHVKNLTGSPLALQDHPISQRSWVSFQIFDSRGQKVSSTGSYSIPPQVLKPGEGKSIGINITPLYKIRTTGQYSIKANVNIASGKSFVTGSLRFNVGKGETFWVEEVLVGQEKRTYSLIRFLERSKSSLYLRVEAIDKNLVYSTTRLGEIVGFTKPQVMFDSEGKIHLLHVSTSTLYRYSRLTKDGALEYQEDRQQTAQGIPALVQTRDGGVQLVGGFDIRQQPQRRKLSEDQMGL